jgi:hypothetical protein
VGIPVFACTGRQLGASALVQVEAQFARNRGIPPLDAAQLPRVGERVN